MFKERPDTERRDSFLNSLLEELEAMHLPKEQAKELEDRIRKKLIIRKDQLRYKSFRSEKTEAKGLDYLGKVRLIEQTLAGSYDLLEILERTPKGLPKRSLVKPVKLDKSGSDLVLHGTVLPEGEEVSMRVRKIGYLRRVKGSIFSV